jgi:hypothetical protein
VNDHVRKILGRNKLRHKDAAIVGKITQQSEIRGSPVLFTADREVSPNFAPDDTRILFYCFVWNGTLGSEPSFD